MSALIPGLTGGIYGKKNKYVAVFRFCDILIFFGTLSMSFRMCGLALLESSCTYIYFGVTTTTRVLVGVNFG